MLKIDKNVPVPPRSSRYPFGDMEVGDSVFSADPKIRNAACTYGSRHGKKFTSHKVADGYRCWRVE